MTDKNAPKAKQTTDGTLITKEFPVSIFANLMQQYSKLSLKVHRQKLVKIAPNFLH